MPNERRDWAIDLARTALRELGGVYVLPDDVEGLADALEHAMRAREPDDAGMIMECHRCGFTNGCAICEDGRRETHRRALGIWRE